MKTSAALSVLFFLASSVSAADLPLVDDVAWGPLRDGCRQLLSALQAAHQPLPDDTARPLRMLLDSQPLDAQAAVHQVQKILDSHCLLLVSINPESRVKAARGPARAVLERGVAKLVLIKVHNDAGVNHTLAIHGLGVMVPGKAEPGCWLEAEVAATEPFDNKLSGQRLEYRVLRLKAGESGKREATLQLDAGQGTQDLGFRAEVPVLFSVK
jgi:hypothetical protein